QAYTCNSALTHRCPSLKRCVRCPPRRQQLHHPRSPQESAADHVSCVCAAIEQVARKPTHGKRWHVAPPKHHCTCPHHSLHGRAVGCGDEVFLQPAAVARGEPHLVDV